MKSATLRELVLVDPTVNSNKYYQAWTIHDLPTDTYTVMFHWGRVGSKGQWSKPERFGTSKDLATQVVDAKIASKQAKGYAPSFNDGNSFGYCPMDVMAALEQRQFDPENDRSQLDDSDGPVDLVAVLFSDIDTCRRLAMGAPSEVTQAVVMRKSLIEQLDHLRSQVMRAEGAAEVVDMLLRFKINA
jgi:predicted DNA-binding WGR domain protein